VGVGRSGEIDDASFRAQVREWIAAAGLAPDVLAAWRDECVFWHCMSRGDVDDARVLEQRLRQLEAAADVHPNRTFYLALPPERFIPTIEALGGAGLAKSSGWTRLVVEKPIGRDLASAREAQRGRAHKSFHESQIFHRSPTWGRETVARFAVSVSRSPIFEELWNRNHVERAADPWWRSDWAWKTARGITTRRAPYATWSRITSRSS
jgi:glucose-6-phosphate 1-dehydrogenase